MSDNLGYFAKHVYEQLELTGATLRRWSSTLESAGYTFEKNAKNQRIYYDKDIDILRELKSLVVDKGQPVEVAAKHLIDNSERDQSLGDHVQDERSPSVQTRPSDIEIKFNKLMEYVQQQEEFKQTLMDKLERQEEFNKVLVEKLESQQKYIDERLETRDQSLMESLRQVQETQKQIAAVNENKEEPKGFFAKLFGK